MKTFTENEKFENSDELFVNCWKCNKPSYQTWAIDPGYIVCPTCGKLYEKKQYARCEINCKPDGPG